MLTNYFGFKLSDGVCVCGGEERGGREEGREGGRERDEKESFL